MIERRLEVKIIRSNLDNLWGVLCSKASRRITRGKGHPPKKNSSRNLNLQASKMFLFQTQTYLEISKELSRKEQKNPGANQQVQERFCNLCKVQRIFEATLPTVMLSKMLGGCFWSKASLSLRNVTRLQNVEIHPTIPSRTPPVNVKLSHKNIWHTYRQVTCQSCPTKHPDTWSVWT